MATCTWGRRLIFSLRTHNHGSTNILGTSAKGTGAGAGTGTGNKPVTIRQAVTALPLVARRSSTAPRRPRPTPQRDCPWKTSNSPLRTMIGRTTGILCNRQMASRLAGPCVKLLPELQHSGAGAGPTCWQLVSQWCSFWHRMQTQRIYLPRLGPTMQSRHDRQSQHASSRVVAAFH